MERDMSYAPRPNHHHHHTHTTSLSSPSSLPTPLPPLHTHTTTTTRLRQVCANFVFLCCTMMADPSGRPPAGGVAQRRRERRLRSWFQQEQQTVRMALATYSHHSAPRRQTKARAGEEGHEQYYAPRRQKPLFLSRSSSASKKSPGTSWRILASFGGPGGCLGWRTGRRGCGVLLAHGLTCQCVQPPSFASRVKVPPPAQGGIQLLGKGDGVDVPVNMLRKFQQLSVWDIPVMLQRRYALCGFAWLWAGFAGFVPRAVFLPVVYRPVMIGIMTVLGQKDSYAATLLQWHVQGSFCWYFSSRCSASWPVSTRRTSSRFVDNGSWMVKAGFTGYDTPRSCSLWFASMPVMFAIMAGMDQKNTFSVGWFPLVQFLDKVVVQTVLTVWKCRCSEAAVHRRSSTSLSLRRGCFPRSRQLSDQRFTSSLTWWTMSLMCGSCRFSGAAVEKTLCSRSCSSLSKLLRRLCADADSHGPDCCLTVEISQFVFDKGDRLPVVQAQQVPQVQSVRRQSRSHSCSSSYSCLDNVGCPLCATTFAWWFREQKTATAAQLQCSDTVSVFLGPCAQVQGVVSTGTRPP